MNKYVVNLDMAKKLWKFGIKIKSEYYYRGKYLIHSSNLGYNVVDTYSAPIAEELLELLPEWIYGEVYEEEFNSRKAYQLYIDINKDCFEVNYECHLFEESLDNFYAESGKLSNALAELLIWCIENGYMEV